MNHFKTALVASLIISALMPQVSGAESLTQCDRINRDRVECRTTTEQQAPVMNIPPGFTTIHNGVQDVPRLRLEEERLKAQQQENELREMQINRTQNQSSSLEQLGGQIEAIEARCQRLFDSRQIKTYYAKVNCASTQVLPMVDRSDVPVGDILKVGYAKAKIIAKKADKKKISQEEMELEEAEIESEMFEKIRQRLQ